MKTDKQTLIDFTKWIISGDTGASSKSLATHMILGKVKDANDFPRDGSDLGRCLRLLKIFPEWKLRINEMECYSGVWALLVKNWKSLEEIMIEETGINFDRAKSSPKTYNLMQKIRKEGLKSQKGYTETSIGDGITICFNHE